MERIRYYLVGKVKFFTDFSKKSHVGEYEGKLVPIKKVNPSGSFTIHVDGKEITTSDVRPITIWIDKWRVDKKRDIEWLIKVGVKVGQGINYRVRCNMLTLQCERNLPDSKDLFCGEYLNLNMPTGYNYALGYSETTNNEIDN